MFKRFAQMILVLTVISLVAGLALGGLHTATKETIAQNILKFKKLPAVIAICEEWTGPLNEADREKLAATLLTDRREIEIEGPDGEPQKVSVFPVKRDGEWYVVALESQGQGFGGPIGIMAGFELNNPQLAGLGITTHSETPGVGSRVTEADFRSQFKGMSRKASLHVKKDGGVIDAVSGATVSSRGVAQALRDADAFFNEHEADIRAALAAGGGKEAQ